MIVKRVSSDVTVSMIGKVYRTCAHVISDTGDIKIGL